MATTVVSIRGLSRLAKTMKKAEMDLSQLKDLNRAAAGVVEDAASSATPRVSGALASTLRSTGTNSAGVVRAGRKAVPYAGVIHWGWPAKNIKAQPWLVDAAKRSEPVWLDTYLDGINKILNNIEGV